ncbi:MAG: TIGR00159 family protein [Calditrichales bacterium]|nr:MAG: TIGR00159 family protein [Calditrichales bacterium]
MLIKLGFLPITIIDVLDIMLVSFLFYQLYEFLKGSIAARMLLGLVVILSISVLGELLNMSALSWIMSNLKTVWVIAFVIVFQPELRRLLIYLGQSRLVRLFVKVSDPEFIEDVIAATIEMSNKNFGAIIVMLRDMGVKSVLETGVILQARVSKPLINSVFNPRSPLHDGALVISGEIAMAAKCILPLSQNPNIDTALGTRHRAAVGISEQTDAIVVVVSEETGMITIAEDGKMIRGLTEEMLRTRLKDAFAPLPKEKKKWGFGFVTGEQ